MTINHSRFDGEGSSGPLALGVWLRALQSYSESSITSAGEAGEEFLLKRDYADDARIVHEVLLRCSQLAVNLAQTESAEAGAGMHALCEIIRDSTHLAEAMLKSSGVGLQGWSSFNNVLLRELNNSAAAERVKSAVTAESAEAVPQELSAIAEKITPEALGADFHGVFAALTRQLEYLNFIETTLKGGRTLKPLLPVFTLVSRESFELLEHIEKRALKYPHAEKWILEALDGTAYAVRMELRKAFDHELAGVRGERQPHYVYAKFENAHGLLRNCFQQSIVSLAQLFEPELEGTQLFEFFQTKLDESLSLRRELWKLLRAVRHAVEDRAEAKLPNLLEQLGSFREHSLRFLMYKDREAFERFCEEVETANGKPELTHVLHRFEAYLETLLSQVNMRAVLADHPFDPNEPA